MSQLDLWVTLLGALTLALGFSAGLLKSRSYLPSQPLVAVVVGVALGPQGLAVLQVTPLGEPKTVLLELARFTVAFAVTSIALRLEAPYFRERARSLAALLGPGMVAMWLASALVASLALPVGIVVALLVGAVVTPTDPVLANAIVVGRTASENIPERVRFLLSGEAGINDGIAYPFVFLPILLLTEPPAVALTDWLLRRVLWGTLGAVVLGATIGVLVGRLERWESRLGFLESTSAFTIAVALTFFVVGATTLAGTDDILAVFVAGLAYTWQADVADEANQQRIEEVFDRLFTVPVFAVFGMVLPWAGWLDLGWRGPALVAGILLFRRLPMVFALQRFVGPLDRPAASLFFGWFGPIGIAAVFYALLAAEHTGVELVWVAGSLVVVGSVFAHGTSGTVATHLYGDLEGTDGT